MTIDDPAPLLPTPPSAPALPLGSGPSLGGQLRRGWAMCALSLIALVPVLFVFVRTSDVRSGIVYWDEFDTALGLVLKLKEGTTPGEFLRDLFALNNEHRMVTSRLLFAGSYWLTGTIDFALIDWIGTGTIVAMCALLLAAVGSGHRRLRLGLLLAFLLFQLEHYENFLWSGSSIDHFQVVFLAAAALVALARGSRAGTLAGVLAGSLATFTLAHGIAVWPVGAVWLGVSRRWRDLALWCGIGALAVGGFFIGFQVNGAESFASFSLGGARQIARYWLAILGAAPALGVAAAAPYWGGVLLALLGYAAARGAWWREPVALPLAGFAVIAAALIAIGRAEHSGGVVFSRYYVLSALAWVLGLFMVLERHTHPRRPLQMMVALLPVLVTFNVLANRRFAGATESWLTCRDIAAVHYKQYSADGHGPFKLHPDPTRATALLQKAEALGVYRIGPVCLPRPFPRNAVENGGINYFVEEISTAGDAASVRGWAAIPGHRAQRGGVHLVLRSGSSTHLFTAVTIPRADVPATTRQAGWANAGFHFARRLDKMPVGDFQIGLLIVENGHPEYIMTGHRLKVGPRGGSPLLAATN